VISKPDVFKSPASDTYIIFGEAKIEDINSQAQAAAAEQFKNNTNVNVNTTNNQSDQSASDVLRPEEVSSTPSSSSANASSGSRSSSSADGADETGLDSDEIQTVINQTQCTRQQAVAALKKSGNIVDAILALTPW